MKGKIIKILLLLLSIALGLLLYFYFFMDMLPRFFANMENIEKNILAALIIILSINVLLKMAFRIDTKIDRYILLLMYLVVLILGLLRPDQQHLGHAGFVGWNPLGFISDIKNDDLSVVIFAINLIIFSPMYFILSRTGLFKKTLTKILVFEAFVLLIEYLQFQLKVGVFDLSDIFLYNIGFFVGYFVSLPFLNYLDKGFEKNIKEGRY